MAASAGCSMVAKGDVRVFCSCWSGAMRSRPESSRSRARGPVNHAMIGRHGYACCSYNIVYRPLSIRMLNSCRHY